MWGIATVSLLLFAGLIFIGVLNAKKGDAERKLEETLEKFKEMKSDLEYSNWNLEQYKMKHRISPPDK